ncbi:MAG: helix-turn-helix domain-containing protein [Mycobacterium sp.]
MLVPDPATLAQISEPDEIAARILQAALEQFELVGVRRTTLQDVARRCGVGRATLYRRFATKEALVDAVVIAEVRRFLIGSARARAQGRTFEESGINSTIFTVKFLRDHALLNKLVQTEPENIMPRFAGDAAALLEFIVDYSTAQWRSELFGDATPRPDQEQHLRTASELTTRLAISFILTPETRIPLDSDDEIREYARNYIMPILTSAKAYPR